LSLDHILARITDQSTSITFEEDIVAHREMLRTRKKLIRKTNVVSVEGNTGVLAMRRLI
jgi:hypothetical protein